MNPNRLAALLLLAMTSFALAQSQPTPPFQDNQTLPAATLNAAFARKTDYPPPPVNLTANVVGILPLANGGTGGSNINLAGFGVVSGILPIVNGGTGISAPVGTFAQSIANGALALATAPIASATCAPVQTVTAANVLTTDVVVETFNSDPTGVVGYQPLTAGRLYVVVYPTAGAVNFKVCNPTTASITPGAITMNWRVAR